MKLNSHTTGNVKFLALAGRFDAYTAPTVRQWLDETITPELANVVVNLEAVVFIDSTALSTLLHGMKKARLQNGDVRLCCLQQPVRIIIELTRLDRVFEIFNTEEEAVNAFKAPKQPHVKTEV